MVNTYIRKAIRSAKVQAARWTPSSIDARARCPRDSREDAGATQRSRRGGAAARRALILVVAIAVGVIAGASWARAEDEPSSTLSFVVLKEHNGKPVRNAAVVLHPVNTHGKQQRGGFELKTDGDGKTHFEGVPYGKMRVQVLAPGFQTYGEDYDVESPTMEITVKLKLPQKQYSIYDEHTDPSKPDDSKKDPEKK